MPKRIYRLKFRRAKQILKRTFENIGKKMSTVIRRPCRRVPIPDMRDIAISQPSIETVEKAAQTKVFLESRYNGFSAPVEDLRRLRSLKSKVRPQIEDALTKSGLEVIRILGKGSFGLVKLVKDPTLNHVYAMKVINKDAMLRTSQEAHLKAERDALVSSSRVSSRWVVPLIASFQDHSNLYLVMDYMIGGDFLGLLLREDMLDEYVARAYLVEMINCVEEVHRMGWLHRDLKPDNFLIAADGHLKISDFGLSFDGHWSHHQEYYHRAREFLCEKFDIKVIGDEHDAAIDADGYLTKREPHHSIYDRMCCQRTWPRRELARSIVGTSQYMAPEIVKGNRYDGRCDWWSIGIMFYECLYGSTPFWHESREEVKRKVANWPDYLIYPTRARYNRPLSASPRPLPPVSNIAQDLISRLITYKELRLSSHRYNESRSPVFGAAFLVEDDSADIRQHPYFTGADWSCRGPAQWIPVVPNAEIDHWFEPESQLVPSCPTKKKRARDKVLRDPELGPRAMEVRKEGAFLGYTWVGRSNPTVTSAATAATATVQ